jgi:hypothetical protein
MKQRFRVFNTHMGDHVAVVEMEESLLEDFVKTKVLDPTTATLRGIKNGGVYTLIPVDDHTVTTLLRVQQVFKNVTETPAKLFSTQVSRMDDLILAVGLLFGEIEYLVVDSEEDLANIINPPTGDYEPKKVKYMVLGDLLTRAKEAAGLEECEPNC